MANHVRKQLRDAVLALLSSSLPSDWDVSARREYPVPSASLPRVSVHVAEETTQRASPDEDDDETVERAVDLRVTLFAKEEELLSVDDKLDVGAVLVEEALDRGVSVDGSLLRLDYQGTLFQFEAAQLPYASAQLRYQVEIITAPGAADAVLD